MDPIATKSLQFFSPGVTISLIKQPKQLPFSSLSGSGVCEILYPTPHGSPKSHDTVQSLIEKKR
jgi:hypothetical protein